MIDRGQHQRKGASVSGPEDLKSFVLRVHKLLGLGYAKLPAGRFADVEEEGITGKLVQAINDVLNNDNQLEWTLFFVHEEPRINDDPERSGKERRRLDIRIEYSMTSPRSQMWFEAKRLEPKDHNVSTYLGSEGLRRFVEGRCAKDEAIGGMLGYVQKGTPEDWAQKIGDAIGNDPAAVRLRKDGGWRAESLAGGIPLSYSSDHDRPTGKPIRIYHSLLIFN